MMRRYFENTSIDHKGKRIAWTISIGVANLDDRAPSVEVLIKYADIVWYEAKQDGRNRVKSYGGFATETNSATNTETKEQ